MTRLGHGGEEIAPLPSGRMKRLLAVLPLALLVTACGSGGSASKPILSHSARIDDVPLRLDVAGVRRIAGAATIDLRLANRAPDGGDDYYVEDTFSNEGNYQADGVLMLDQRTGRELAPLQADDLDMQIAPGGTQAIQALFPAPRGDQVDVLVPHFGLFRNVPVR
jgi:hypothetical protein